MTASLAREVGIVTGGASGLGLEIVRIRAAEAEVVIADLNDQAGE
jgi:NAD(P)-dependent dehydrogenase (short-subunit alcohol dehydrogenase family)